MRLPLLLAATLLAAGTVLASESACQNFITAHAGRLFDGGQEFRFLSFDIPNLLEIEDNVGFTNHNPWRLPDAFEINDALATLRQMGGTVARTYVITVRRTNDPTGAPRHVLAPGRFDEASFRTMDEVLAAANRTGVRLIIPLVDNWPWMGGRAEYAAWRGKNKDDFWTDPQLITDFEQTIHFVLARTNTVTGVRYADDKAILCWETGNEVYSPPAWTREIARCLKAADPNHLVMDGFNATELREESLAMTNIDIVTTHHYPGSAKSFADLIRANGARAKGRKAYLVGEFGFANTADMIHAMDAIVESGASGGLLWSLRFRNRDGGFYWHSEPSGGNLYKAFHWPASPMGEPYDEANLLHAVREKAFGIRGLPVSALAPPLPPKLLPIANAAAISWQGSVGATGYQVERALQESGAWQILATNVDEAFTQYRPQFADETPSAKVGPLRSWYYRVRARNDAGLSAPSNIAGPAQGQAATLVDELSDFSRVREHSGHWRLDNQDCRAANEDAHRMAGAAGDCLVYELPAPINGFQVFAWFPHGASVVKFFTSEDGLAYRAVPARQEQYSPSSSDYPLWPAIRFHAEKLAGGRFMKIELTGETQLGRVEITHQPFIP